MKRQKIVFSICFVLIISLVFAALDSQATQVPLIKRCFDKNGAVIEPCMNYAQPTSLSDCALLPLTLTDYETKLTRCHALAMRYDSSSCDLLTLNQTYKDSCFNQANMCEKISDSAKKTACVERVDKKNFDSATGTVIMLVLLLIYLLSPLGIILVILRTIYDLIKKNKFSLGKRIFIIIMLLIIWFFIAMIAGLPPFEIFYQAVY